MKALTNGTYRLVGEMAATMALQGGLLPQMFDTTSVRYFLDSSIDVVADYKDLPGVKRDIIQKVCYADNIYCNFSGI